MQSLLQGEDTVAFGSLWQRVPGTLSRGGGSRAGRLMLCPLHVRTPCRLLPPRMHGLHSLDIGFRLWPRPQAPPRPGRTTSACLGEQPVPSQALGHSDSCTLVRAFVFLQPLPYELSMKSPRFQTGTLRHEEVKATRPRPYRQQVVESGFEPKSSDSSPLPQLPCSMPG